MLWLVAAAPLALWLLGSRAMAALTYAAWCGAGTATIAAMAIGFRGTDRGLGSVRALVLGLAATGVLVWALRSQPIALAAALPALVGVVVIAWSPRAMDRAGAERAAFELLIAIVLVLGAVACAAVGAASSIVVADPRALPAARAVLGRAALFALPPIAAAAIVLASRLALVGRGSLGRWPELAGAVGVAVFTAGVLRAGLAPALVPPAPSAARPPPPPPPPSPPAPPPAPEPEPEPAVRDAAVAAPDDAATDAAVVIGEAQVNGMLVPVEVERGLEKIAPRLERCREKADGSAGGTILVRFSIGPSGSVANVQEADETTIQNAELVGCVLASFYQIGFPAPTRGYVRVEVPIRIGTR